MESSSIPRLRRPFIITFNAWRHDHALGLRRPSRLASAEIHALRKFLEANGAGIAIPDDRNFETEGQAIESGLRRTVEGRATVMRSLIRAVYRFRDAALVAENKDDFGNALQNLYRELEHAEDLVGPPG